MRLRNLCRLLTIVHLGHALVCTPSPSPPPFLLDASPTLLLRTSLMTPFAAPHFPSVLLMNTFKASTNRVLNALPYRSAFFRLVLSMKGDGGEASQLRYPCFLCRAWITAGPETSARKANNASKSNIPNCSVPFLNPARSRVCTLVSMPLGLSLSLESSGKTLLNALSGTRSRGVHAGCM